MVGAFTEGDATEAVYVVSKASKVLYAVGSLNSISGSAGLAGRDVTCYREFKSCVEVLDEIG